MVEFFSPAVRSGVADGDILMILLQEGSTILGIWGEIETTSSLSGTKATVMPVSLKYLVTPSAGSHTYKVTAFNFAGSNALVNADVGGDGAHVVNAFFMVTKLA